jgi:hypothetical protein
MWFPFIAYAAMAAFIAAAFWVFRLAVRAKTASVIALSEE